MLRARWLRECRSFLPAGGLALRILQAFSAGASRRAGLPAQGRPIAPRRGSLAPIYPCEVPLARMNRVWVRTAIVGVVVVALVAGAVYLRNRPQGLPIADFPPVDSKGYLAAIMEKDGHSRVVAILPDGTIREAPGDGEMVDAEITWKPDGKRIVFVSN